MFKEDKNKQVKIYEVAEDFSILLIREDCGKIGYNWTMYYDEERPDENNIIEGIVYVECCCDTNKELTFDTALEYLVDVTRFIDIHMDRIFEETDEIEIIDLDK